MSNRKPQGTWVGNTYVPPTSYTVKLDKRGKGAALDRYNRLEKMLRQAVTAFRHGLLFDYARTLQLYMQTTRWKIRNAPHWELEIEPDEWQVISRGLRELNTPAANSMYQWLNIHKEKHDE